MIIYSFLISGIYLGLLYINNLRLNLPDSQRYFSGQLYGVFRLRWLLPAICKHATEPPQQFKSKDISIQMATRKSIERTMAKNDLGTLQSSTANFDNITNENNYNRPQNRRQKVPNISPNLEQVKAIPSIPPPIMDFVITE